MPLWGTNDTEDDMPNFSQDKDKTYFLDIEEAIDPDARNKGAKTPGWNTYNSYVDCNGNTRHKVESLVVIKRTKLEAGDRVEDDFIDAP